MTTIPPMIRARVDGIPGLATKGHTGQQSKMGDQSRQLGQLSIDRSRSAAGSISINNPSINMLEASGNRLSLSIFSVFWSMALAKSSARASSWPKSGPT
jgi:hypothetical protein